MTTFKARYAVPAAVLAAALVVSGCDGDSSTTMNMGDNNGTMNMDDTTTNGDDSSTTNGDDSSTTNGDDSSTTSGDDSSTTSDDDTATPGEEATAALNDLKDAIDAVHGESEDSKVTAAETALTRATMEVNEVPAAERSALSERLGELRATLDQNKESRTAAIREKERMNVGTGKAMYAALHGPNPGAIVPRTNTALNNLESAAQFFQPDDVPSPRPLQVDAAVGAGSLPDSDDAPNLTLGKGAPAAGTMFKGYKYRDYTYTSTPIEAAGTNRARVYSSRMAPVKRLLKDHFGDSNTKPSRVTSYNAATRTVSLPTRVYYGIESPEFPQAGSKIFREGRPVGEEIRVPGTYDGAPGEYVCTPSNNEPCNAGQFSDRGESGISLSAGWTFVHEEGAMVDVLDNDYYYFGWWLREDSDGMPVAASAFWNQNGTRTVSIVNQLTGRASYAGLAVGLYGIKLSLPGDNDGFVNDDPSFRNGGHFTADINLDAVFGSSGNLSGTIDNFRLNNGDADPGWSVALKEVTWSTSGWTTATPANNTVWTINGTAAEPSGQWRARMYDQYPDGETAPTDAGGTFYTEFNNTHRMVGAFTAKKPQEE